jgi:hypothetical protein
MHGRGVEKYLIVENINIKHLCVCCLRVCLYTTVCAAENNLRCV